jgi:hypothetical protein
MGAKGEADTKTNWSTDRQPQDELNSTLDERYYKTMKSNLLETKLMRSILNICLFN